MRIIYLLDLHVLVTLDLEEPEVTTGVGLDLPEAALNTTGQDGDG